MNDLIQAAKEYLAGEIDEDSFSECLNFFAGDSSKEDFDTLAKLIAGQVQ